jgi:TM2 domain-containing membrane protein YozV
MNCANHTERTATAFCQNCGKPLCPECTRSADGSLLCAPCLLARHPDSVLGQTVPGSGQTPFTSVPNAAGQYPPAAYLGRPSPFLAGMLGFIPGVGAMYNGQFLKGLIHVVIFIVLIGISTHLPLFGILIAAWVFYQVFDAVHTASARRDGLPLPDPFGILDLSHRMGPTGAYPGPSAGPAASGFAGSPAPGPAAGYAPRAGAPYAPPPAPGYAPPAGGYAAPGQPTPFTPVNGGYAPIPPQGYYVRRRGEPIGAIILIGLGLLFLLNTLDVFDFDWISRGWPLFLLALGVWLLIRRTTGRSGSMPGPPPPASGSYPGAAQGGSTPAAPASGTGLSIYSTGEQHPHSEEEKS